MGTTGGWARGPLLGFDTETTGVDVAHDRVVTAALVRRERGVVTAERTWLLDPGVEIPAEAAAIHGITTVEARAHGGAPAPALDEIAGLLALELAAGVPVVAYNAAFDLSLLDAELARHGLPTLRERLGREVFPVVDPLVLDRWCDPGREGKRRLGDLCAHYGVTGEGALHTARVDVVATLDVLDALLDRFPGVAGESLEALHDVQVGAHREWAAVVGAEREREGLVGAAPSGAWPVQP